MDLIERYLTAIRWNLTGGHADDIIAELRDLIASRIEDREEALGRTLTRDETADLLRDFGHPLVVAARYGSQQHLIGPETFPFYFFALKIVLAICAGLIVLTTAVQMVFHPADGAQALSRGFQDAWWSLLGNAALVTLVFAVIERTGLLTRYLQHWKPEQLPDLSELRIKPKKAWESGFEVALGLALLAWWGGLIHIPIFYSTANGIRVEPAPVWTLYYWPIFALIAARLVENLITWLRPRWRLVRAVLGVAVAIAGVALLTRIYRAGEWVVVVSTGMPADQVADIQQSLHLALSLALVVVGVVWVLQALGALWRLWRARG